MATQNSGVTNNTQTAFGSNLLSNTKVTAPNYSNAQLSTQDPKEVIKLSIGGPKADPSKPDFSNSLRYPAKPGITDKTDYVMFNFYRYTPPFSSGSGLGNTALERYNTSSSQYEPSRQKLKQIMLYMPEDVSTGYKTNWSGKNFGNTAADAMRAFGSANVFEGIGETINNIGKGVDRLPAIMGAKAVQATVQTLTGEQPSLDDIFGSTRGVIFNPNTELLFSGFDLRNFTLNFKLVPRNKDEANIIEEIILTFKRAMLPSFSTGTEITSGLGTLTTAGLANALGLGGGATLDKEGYKANYISVPDLVKVTFMSGANKNPHVPQYKMCALTQIDLNYTPDGVYATTTDGRMVAYQMSLNFQETKLVYAEEVGEY